MSRIKSVSRVIGIKEREKEEKEAEVKHAMKAVDIEKSKLDRLNKSLDDAIAIFVEKQSGRFVNANELGFLYDYCSHVDGRINLQEKALSLKQDKLDEKMHTLVEAYRENKLLNIFRDRLVSEKTKEEALSEQKGIDAIFVSRRGFER